MGRPLTILAVAIAALLANIQDAHAVPDVGAVRFGPPATPDLFTTLDSRTDHVRLSLSWRGATRARGPYRANGLMDPACDDDQRFNWCTSDEAIGWHAALGKEVRLKLVAVPEEYWEPGCVVSPPAQNACRPTRAGLDEWREFTARAIRRYGPEGDYWTAMRMPARFWVDTWEIWNEPNLPGFWDGDRHDDPRSDAEEYEALLRAASRARIFASTGGRPPVRLAAPAFGGGQGGRGGVWMQRFSGIASPADYERVSLHPYGETVAAVTNRIAWIRRMLPRKPIWVTEHGWGTSTNGRRPFGRLTLEEQKTRFEELMAKLDRSHPYVESYTWFTGVDICARSDGAGNFCNFGLYDNGPFGNTRKPIIAAFQRAATAE